MHNLQHEPVVGAEGNHKTFRQWISNGGRMDVATASAAAIAIVMFLYTLFNGSSSEFRPLNYESPAIIEGTNSDPDSAEDIVIPGDTMMVRLRKCADHDRVVFSSAYFLPEARNADLQLATFNALSLLSGCEDVVLRLPVPEALTVGIWRLEGQDTVRDGSRTFTEEWHSEPFRVGESRNAND